MKGRKRILWLVSWYPNRNDRFDGDFIQRHARAAAIHHDIHVIFVTDSEMEKSVEEEVNYVTGLTEQVIYFKRSQAFLGRFKKQWLWRRHFHDAVNAYIKKTGIPDLVHVHIPWKAGLVALWMKKSFGISYILTEHWGMYDRNSRDNLYNRSALTQSLLKEIYFESLACSTVSRYLSEGVQRFSGKNCSHIIPNVVDTSLFYPKQGKYARFTFIHISNMAPVKNVQLILEAFHKLILQQKDVQLIMVGNRDQKYVEIADEFGLLNQSVFFRGEIPYTEVAGEMRRSHCLIIASVSETFSCVTAEALCTGLPVIASEVGALPELVSSANGILTPVNNKSLLEKAMVEMIDDYSRFNRQSISDSAIKKYSYSSVSEVFKSFYEHAERLKNGDIEKGDGIVSVIKD